jgi:dTDP-4-amino-4,6-dideoxygalactose transaminase
MWHLAAIFVNPDDRLRIFTKLREKGVGVQVNYLPAYRHPVFRDTFDSARFPNSERHYSSEISLPMSAHLSESEVAFICKTLKESL